MLDSKKDAVVVFSGGQDSTTCLGLAIKVFGADRVQAIGFNYGQRHAVELRQAEVIAGKLGVDFYTVDLPFLPKMVTSALTNTVDRVSEQHSRLKSLPASFVPARNALMLTISHAAAQELGAQQIYTGVCQTDYSGYPDCRDVFIRQLERTLNAGYESNIEIITPLMFINKAATFKLAADADVLGVVLDHSHTCYEGDRSERHDWGFGCGECPACKLREKGWNEYIEHFA
jgi:7-cyano-7-deazaguanine synthase